MRIVNKELLKQIRSKRCIVCGALDPDPHHVKSKKSGGDDVESNLMPLCREHHQEIHKIGINKFITKYPVAKYWLLNNGWELNPLTMKWYQSKAGTIN
jgi:hypothetical protein